MTLPGRRLTAEPLDAQAFRPFGDVIEASADRRHFEINRGDAVRYDDLAAIDVAAAGGRPVLSIFRARAHALPLRLVLMERHPLASQAFVPLGPHPYLVVVAPAGSPPAPAQIRCFLASPGQGVNYAPGTWHHPLLALHATSDFLVVDRGGPDTPANCDEHPLDATPAWVEG